MKPAVAATTLRQVLKATGGFSGETEDDAYGFAAARDWIRAILAGAVRPPGEAFDYSNGGAHLLSAILVQATGQSVLEYARVKLFDPLGIETRPALEVQPVERERDRYARAGFAWLVDPQGRHLGSGFMKLKPADLAKLGVLFSMRGAGRAGRSFLLPGYAKQQLISSVPSKPAMGSPTAMDTCGGRPPFRTIRPTWPTDMADR